MSGDADDPTTAPTIEASALPEGKLPGPAVDVAEQHRVFGALFPGAAEPQRIGRFVVLRTLGRGGMGTVFEAFDRTLDRRVALKVLHEELGVEHTQRLIREAQALAKLSHPNVVQVYEVEQTEGRSFIAMELVQGQPLHRWLRQKPRPSWSECVEVYLQAGEGLAAAHAEGMVHRDFKPSNVVIDDKGRVRVLDFGLARQAGSMTEDNPTLRDRQVDDVALQTPLTQTGTVVGTPAYMPLEQMYGHEADARSDQFAFCVSLYEALYARRPFEGDTMHALAMSLTAGAVRPAPKGSAVPEALRTIVVRGLSTESSERWPSMDALLAELRRLVAPRSRRWVAWGLTAGLTIAGGGLALGQYVQVKDRCTGAAVHLAGIWDEAGRERVEAAIVGTELAYAPQTWERVEGRLDEYAERWIRKHTEVCEATSVRREQTAEAMDLRMGCLHERRGALSAAVKVLTEADAEVVENAMDVIGGLPTLARCDDLEALRAAVPPPDDPDSAEEVEAIREQAEELGMLTSAGKYTRVLESFDPLVTRAEALGYLPLVAELKRQRGWVRALEGQLDGAEQDLEQAYAVAVEHRHDDVAVSAATSLIFALGELGRPVEALVWGDTALPLANRRREGRVLGALLNHLGLVYRSQGEYDKAQHHHERALELLEEALGPEHPHVATTIDNLAAAVWRRGKYEQARAHYERALTLQEKVLGPDHPGTIRSIEGLGTILVSLGDNGEAKRYLERALETRERIDSTDRPAEARALNNLGIVMNNLGEYEVAERHHRRALRLWEDALGADHPHIADGASGLGNVYTSQGKYEEAVRHMERALRIQQAALHPEHPQTALTLNNLGSVLTRLGQYDQAEARIVEALRIREKTLGADHPNVAQTVNNLAVLAQEQGDYEGAMGHYRRTLQILEKSLPAEHPHLAYPLRGLAFVALEQEDFAAAREYAARIVSLLEAAEGDPGELAAGRFSYARALWPDKTQRARAHGLAEQAKQAFAAIGERGQDDLAKVDKWLAEHPRP